MPKAKLLTDVNNPYFKKNIISTSTTQPTTGAHTIGDIVLSSNPTASCYGWICTQTGTPGSWMVLKSASDWSSISGKPSTFTPTLGTSSTTAFRGDQGQVAYNHSQAAHAPVNAQRNADITKAEIEAKLTGSVNTHIHNRLDINNSLDVNTLPNSLPNGVKVQDTWNTMTIKGSEHITQLSPYESNGGSQLWMRHGKNNAWSEWVRFFNTKDTSISVNPVGDHGFGCDGKPSGFIGSYPGWDKNTLYINTYSKEGNMAQTFTNVEINTAVTKLNSDLRVKHSSYLPNVKEVGLLEFGNTYGTNYMSVGNGDGATHATHNLIIRSWWGIGFRNNNNDCTVVMNTRSGDIHARGMIRADGGMNITGKNIKIQWEDPGDIGEGGIWIRS